MVLVAGCRVHPWAHEEAGEIVQAQLVERRYELEKREFNCG